MRNIDALMLPLYHDCNMNRKRIFRAIEKKRDFERVAEMIREKIENENLPDGLRLPRERELASELGVSRAMFREALRILDVMGYVKIKKGPKGGIFVSKKVHKPLLESLRNMAMSGKVKIEDIFDIRTTIEPEVIRQAIKNMGTHGMQRIFNLKSAGQEHLEKNDTEKLKRTNVEFHSLIAELSGNPIWKVLVDSLIETLLYVTKDFLDPNFEKSVFDIHLEIANAIMEHRVGDAQRLMLKDILFVKERVKEFLETKDR